MLFKNTKDKTSYAKKHACNMNFTGTTCLTDNNISYTSVASSYTHVQWRFHVTRGVLGCFTCMLQESNCPGNMHLTIMVACLKHA